MQESSDVGGQAAVRASNPWRLDLLVLVLSETVLVLVLVLEQTMMTKPIFDHERLDVYRLSIEYVAMYWRIAK